MTNDLSSFELAVATSDALSVKPRMMTAGGADEQIKASSRLLGDRLAGMLGIVVVIAALMLLAVGQPLGATIVFLVPYLIWIIRRNQKDKRRAELRKAQLKEFEQAKGQAVE